MSHTTQFRSLNAPLETLTGNFGGPIGPVGGNVNILGTGGLISVEGNLATHTLNLVPSATIAALFPTDTLDVVPVTNAVSILGGLNIGTVGFTGDPGIPTLSTITINLDDNVSITGTFDSVGDITTSDGDIVSTLGAGSFATSVTVGNDLHVLAGGADIVGIVELSDLVAGTMRTDASGVISALADGAVGELLISDTGGVPIWATLTAGANIGIVNAANSITISSPGIVASVTAGTNLNDSGTATDPVINLDAAISLTTVTATTFETSVAAAYLSLSGTSIIVDGTDANIDINITAKGTGQVIIDDLQLATDLEVQYGGTGVSILTQYGVLVGNAATDIQALAVGATNQVLLGNTGANPSWGTVGNTALTNSSVTLSNGANITITGSPLSLGGTATIALSGTTDHTVQVGNATGSVTSLSVGTNGQVLLGSSAANPVFATITSSDTSISFTAGAGTLSIQGTAASTSQVGSVELTTDAEAIDGTDTTRAVTAEALKAKFGAQTSHGLPYGAGTTTAVAWTAEPSDGQILIGDTAAIPQLGTITAGTGITVTNAAHSITVASTGTTLNNQTGTAYTTVLLDAGKAITMTNAAASTLTIPLNSSVAYPVGTQIAVVQLGAGQVTLTPTAGVTFRSADDAYKLVKQYSGCVLIKLLSDTWGIYGDCEA